MSTTLENTRSAPEQAPGPAFDSTARDYDRGFSHTTLGRFLRSRVWAHLDTVLAPGDRILELGCGTGEDAIFLASRGHDVVAVDSSGVMVSITQAKARDRDVQDRITTLQADLNDPELFRSAAWKSCAQTGGRQSGGRQSGGRQSGEQRFDSVLSNFGALNCVGDRRSLARSLAALLRPGGRAILVVMGPLCLVESAAFLMRGRVSDATRRLRSRSKARVGNGSVEVSFPSVGTLAREFADGFTLKTAYGIGTVLPTTEMTAFVDRHPRLFGALSRIEPLASRLGGRFFADHYLVDFERRSP